MKNREQLLKQIYDLQHDIYELMAFYGEAPYHYGDISIHQAEGEILSRIAEHPSITVTELGKLLNKTTSACSQTVAKLRKKGVVEQKRNQDNPMQYNLSLTELGQQIYEDRRKQDVKVWNQTVIQLDDFSEEDLEAMLRIQKKINKYYLSSTGE